MHGVDIVQVEDSRWEGWLYWMDSWHTITNLFDVCSWLSLICAAGIKHSIWFLSVIAQMCFVCLVCWCYLSKGSQIGTPLVSWYFCSFCWNILSFSRICVHIIWKKGVSIVHILCYFWSFLVFVCLTSWLCCWCFTRSFSCSLLLFLF